MRKISQGRKLGIGIYKKDWEERDDLDYKNPGSERIMRGFEISLRVSVFLEILFFINLNLFYEN